MYLKTLEDETTKKSRNVGNQTVTLRHIPKELTRRPHLFENLNTRKIMKVQKCP
jgi:hypothetical protein